MMRDTGLRRTALLTGALAAAGVAGTIAVGMAAYAAERSAEPESATTEPSPASSATAGTLDDWPSLSGGDTGSDAGQATSGGS